MKHIKLVDIVLTKKEKEDIIEYCSILGYIFDEEPNEFEGKYPLIRNKFDGNRKGYIQRYNNHIYIVYGRKSENLTFNINMLKNYLKFFDKLKLKPMMNLIELMSGITDFYNV